MSKSSEICPYGSPCVKAAEEIRTAKDKIGLARLLFVAEGLCKRSQLLQIRLQMLLVISPSAHRSFEHWLGDIRIGGRTDHLLTGVFVELQDARVPREFQKVKD